MLCATHFHEIFKQDLLSDETERLIHYYMMEIIETEKHLTFLYRAIQGKCMKSWGRYVASLAGIPNDILDRGDSLSRDLTTYQPIEKNKELSLLEERRHDAALMLADCVRQHLNDEADTVNLQQVMTCLQEIATSFKQQA